MSNFLSILLLYLLTIPDCQFPDLQSVTNGKSHTDNCRGVYLHCRDTGGEHHLRDITY